MLAPIVGVHHHPPAKFILPLLAVGTSLRIEPEPDNPHDSAALRVYVSAIRVGDLVSELPPDERDALDTQLLGCGIAVAELPDEIMLGYIAASGGKPLAKAQLHRSELVGNVEFADFREAILAYGPNGEPYASA